MAGVHEIDDCSRRIVERPDIESIGAQDDDVGVLARAQRADLAVEVCTTGTLDGGELEHLPTRQQRRQVLLAVAPTLQDEIALRDGGRSHEREEIRRERHGVIGAEAGAHAVVERVLNRRGSVPHGHLDRRRERHVTAAVLDQTPGISRKMQTMNIFVARAQQTGT